MMVMMEDIDEDEGDADAKNDIDSTDETSHASMYLHPGCAATCMGRVHNPRNMHALCALGHMGSLSAHARPHALSMHALLLYPL